MEITKHQRRLYHAQFRLDDLYKTVFSSKDCVQFNLPIKPSTAFSGRELSDHGGAL
jgi:hypothetical protein